MNDTVMQLQRWRRDLHRIPETRLELPKTAAYLKEQLKGTGGQLLEPEGVGSSFGVYFDMGFEDTMAFRSDMDALPAMEQTGCDFASVHEGYMHACGHDGHMAMLLGLAWHVHDHADSLKCNVLLLFQAGEETPGGARLLCESGMLKDCRVKAVFGIHLWPVLDKGIIATRPRELMAKCAEVHIDIEGKSSHAARYREGIDALEQAARLLLEMYALEQSLDPSVYRLLRFGSLHGGQACNIVCDKVHMEGTLRAFDDSVFDGLHDGILALAASLESETGVKIHVRFSQGYPAVINDERLAQTLLETTEGMVRLEEPEMISEDFSYYQKEAPGVFFFLGTGTGIPLHSSRFQFEEDVLEQGVKLYASLLKQADTILKP